MTNKDVIAFVKKNPIGVGCGVLALALAAGIYLRGDNLPAAQTQLEQIAKEGDRLATNIKNAARLEEQLAALTAAEKQIDPRIVHGSELAKNLQYFYKLEADTGTKLSDLRQISSGALVKGQKTIFTSVSFSFSVQGEYPALLDCLRRLEHGTYFCRVVTANVTVPNETDRSGPLKLNLVVELLGLP